NGEMCIPLQELPFSIKFEEGTVSSSNPIEGWLSRGGFFLALIFLFLGGLALNLTPCVYPMVPITIGFFSKQKKSFLLSLFYFLGIVITYSLLGTISALGGSLFGSALQKPLVLIIVAIIIFIFSLSLFGLYTFKLPSTFSSNISSKIGFFSTFLMGAMVGLIAAPCLGPIILSLITFVASKGDAFLGFIFFLALSSGLGLPYLLLSFFSSSIKSLPKSGEWMVSLERFFGFALIGVSIFILSPVLPSKLPNVLYLILGIISLIYFLKLIFKRNKWLNFSLATISLIFLIINLNSLIPKREKIKLFTPYSKSTFSMELESGKPIMLDFYAAWCIPCKEMEHKTFSNKEVQEILKNFVLFQVDLTKEPEGEVLEIVEKVKVEGIPTIVFYKDGKEIEELRLVGFEGPEEFKIRLIKVLE
ncbi:MAG: cytochrome c biogenesis protein CcdA, partial [Thermoanaerobaculia bacterium]